MELEKYEVIESFCEERFKDHVNSRLADGWVLQGGVQVVNTDVGVRYYQAILLPHKAPPDMEVYHNTEEGIPSGTFPSETLHLGSLGIPVAPWVARTPHCREPM